MSKRDDLDNEARGEIGLFGALLLGGGSLIATAISKGIKKDKLKVQIDEIRLKISNIERQISEEEGKFFLLRDESKISSLKQKRNQLVEENKDLLNKYNKLLEGK